MVTVRAPATCANLGAGFDSFGVAIGEPADSVVVERADEIHIDVSGVGANEIPTDPAENVVGAVAETMGVGASIAIEKGVPPGAGLGSSAASAAGAALGLSELYDMDLSRVEMVEIAARGEAVAAGTPHRDNVAAALFGGFTIAADADVVHVETDIPLVVCVPDLSISTETAREVIPRAIDTEAHVQAIADAATLAVGMERSDPTTVGAGLRDGPCSRARTGLIPGYETVRSAALDGGATGIAVSGAGPTVVATCAVDARPAVAEAMVDAFASKGRSAEAIQTRSGAGATVV